FGSFKRNNIPHLVNLNGVLTEVYFAPSDSVDRNMDNYLSKSNSGIFFSAYDFKSQAVYNTLYRLRQGRHIRGVFDLSKSGTGVFGAMKPWADVWIDSTAGKLQHSYFITDPVTNSPGTGVITGSYNWTPESNLYNDEDVLIFHSPVIANQFYQEFHQRYKEASGHPVKIQNISSEVPDGYKLYRNFPNPFNPVTKIRFSLPVSSEILLEVYNILGQKITTLASGKYNAGTYEVSFDASDLPGGVYICRLSSGKFTETSKMILIK
ncbi:MAG: T9SS type A sorting domain-containing protein, partial [Ignavibacteria bacterium]|nr:T9SS type A sorting domain-containing protein [Ignavibacteria bacterium]